ncbi:unnamed protein product [Cuscuta campestris]|uniref:BAG domain-containing protein n=1 Tax=Cuscuta campestris TaxID=132261 RepID=A0A484N1Z0_9ASTE|nr:unnamed protein product [Cuscuta campestris]
MGILSAVGKEREIVRESKRTKMIVITLEAEGQRLDVTLFGEYVDVLKSFFRHTPLEHAVIVIQYAKVKMFQEDGSFENPKEFDDLLLGKTYIFKVESLKDCTEDGEYAVYGTIKGVDGGADWFIPTCRCGSEVIPRNGFYYCSDCKKCVVNVIPRYRIKARVNDASDSATFVIFESLGCLLLHKSCSEMLKFCEVSALESVITKVGKVAEETIVNLIELLMNQLLKLDGIITSESHVKSQRKFQVERVQKCVETLDVLKMKKTMLNKSSEEPAQKTATGPAVVITTQY